MEMPCSLSCKDTASGLDAQAANGEPQRAAYATIGGSLRRWGSFALCRRRRRRRRRRTRVALSTAGPVRVIERAAAEAQGRLQGGSFKTDNWLEVDGTGFVRGLRGSVCDLPLHR
jgi:hypothetical protein